MPGKSPRRAAMAFYHRRNACAPTPVTLLRGKSSSSSDPDSATRLEIIHQNSTADEPAICKSYDECWLNEENALLGRRDETARSGVSCLRACRELRIRRGASDGETFMFGRKKGPRIPAAARHELSHMDARLLRDMGFNPDDFRDSFEGRRSSLLFSPFRHPRED